MSTATTTLPTSNKIPPSRATARSYPKPIWLMILISRYIKDYIGYRKTGITPYEACVNVRRLFRLTNGRFNDVVAWIDGLLHRPRPLPTHYGVLEKLTPMEILDIAKNLRAEGFHIFNTLLPKDLCDRLYQFATQAHCRVESHNGIEPDLHVYDPNNLLGTRYTIESQVLHEHPDVQQLAIDPTILAVVQSHFGCQPVFMGCEMWWSTAFSNEACERSAQLYHFDMPQVKFLKIFVYLTDVDELAGPHKFVRGTHTRIPRSLREDRRYQDEEIFAHFGADRVVSMAGPTGTFFAEDTRGFHKGSPVQEGHRLLLQLQYGTSGFGGVNNTIEINDHFSDNFSQMPKLYPRIFAPRFRKLDKARTQQRV